jgi:peroxiredoxin family protein
MTVDEAIEFMQELKTQGKKHIIVGVWTADLFEVKDDDAWGEVAKDIDDNATSLWDDMFSNLQFAVDSASEGVTVTRTEE